MTRLDALLVARGLARSRAQAAALIRAGKVRVPGVSRPKPATTVAPDIALDADSDPWVSRAAHKLLGALTDLEITIPDRVLDAGSSTGGFTQVALAHGAQHVYAVDVGTDQLAASLRTDPRVTVHERTNLRDLSLAHVDHAPVDLVVADVSFISLTLLFEPLFSVLREDGQALLLVKPQFEVGRERLGKGGVVRDPVVRAQACADVEAAAAAHGWQVYGTADSRLPGPAGNVEHFLLLGSPHLC